MSDRSHRPTSKFHFDDLLEFYQALTSKTDYNLLEIGYDFTTLASYVLRDIIMYNYNHSYVRSHVGNVGK